LPLQSVKRYKSLYEQTYAALRASILSGELAPGARLIETQLAERLQVSRTPIREAIRQLQRESLITDDLGDGLRVRSISIADAIHLYDCRIALEQVSVAGACHHATNDQLQKLHDCVMQAERFAESAPHSASSHLLALDSQFHRCIAESCGNQWLVDLLDQVFDKMTLLRAQTTQHNPDVLEIRGEHRQIFNAIAQRDADSAVQAIHQHLAASKQRVIQEVQNIQRTLTAV
jgi:DNA-binding GntR family transcriptional regulator